MKMRSSLSTCPRAHFPSRQPFLENTLPSFFSLSFISIYHTILRYMTRTRFPEENPARMVILGNHDTTSCPMSLLSTHFFPFFLSFLGKASVYRLFSDGPELFLNFIYGSAVSKEG